MVTKSPWIHLTNRCNMSCNYCYIQRDDRDMSLPVFDKLNQYYRQLVLDRKATFLYYRLSGGEPMLVLSRYLGSLQLFMDEMGDDIHVEILTNGTFVDSDIVAFIDRNVKKMGLCVSIDRVSQANIIDNISQWKRSIPSLGIGISTVILNNGDFLADLAEYVGDNRFVWDVNYDKYSTSDLNVGRCKINITQLINRLNCTGYPLTLMRFNGINFHYNDGCGAGERLEAVDVEGKIYPCQTLIGRKQWHSVSWSECDTCSIVRFCGRGCQFHNTSREIFCELNQYYFATGGPYAISLSV